MNIKVKFARQYALQKHGNQMYGEKPYSFHLDEVYEIIKAMNLGEDYEVAAYLHDVLEDTTHDSTGLIKAKKEIMELFGEHVLNMVFAVSGFGDSRESRQADIKNKMHQYPDSIDLKMADRLANMRHSKIDKPSLFKRYCREHLELEEIFSQGHQELFDLLVEQLPVASITIDNETLKSKKLVF